MSQPHRQGNNSQLCADALGRFVLGRRLRREFYDAGNRYAELVRSFHTALKTPRPIIRGASLEAGSTRSVLNDFDLHVPGRQAELIKRAAYGFQIARKLNRLERRLIAVSRPGFAAMRALAVFEQEIAPQEYPAAARVLEVLAGELGIITGKMHPFH